MDSNINPPFGTRARLGLGFGPGRMTPLRLLAAIALIYLSVASVFLFFVGTNPLILLIGVLRTFPSFFGLAARVAPMWFILAVVGGLVAIPYIRRRIRQNLSEIILIAIYSSLFTVVFGLVKNHLPAVFPFWSDAVFTGIDSVMTPRAIVAWMDNIPLSVILALYFNVWVLCAAFFPMILAIVDPNDTRRRIFTALWAVCWIGLGNILAAGFMSVGPMFLDRLPGGDPSVYPELFELLARPETAPLLAVKDRLWDAYANSQFMVGSGISAFPSVHVGMATVVALYLATILSAQARAHTGRIVGRLSKAAAILLPVAIVATYQLVTVYIGMHYAIDGYVSIILMLGAHALLKRSPLGR